MVYLATFTIKINLYTIHGSMGDGTWVMNERWVMTQPCWLWGFWGSKTLPCSLASTGPPISYGRMTTWVVEISVSYDKAQTHVPHRPPKYFVYVVCTWMSREGSAGRKVRISPGLSYKPNISIPFPMGSRYGIYLPTFILHLCNNPHITG